MRTWTEGNRPENSQATVSLFRGRISLVTRVHLPFVLFLSLLAWGVPFGEAAAQEDEAAKAKPADAPAPEGPSKEVRGAVVDPEGAPLSGASLTVVDGGKGSTVSGADGSYVFTGLPSGDVTIRASKTGYIDMYLTFSIWTDEKLKVDAEMYSRVEEIADFQTTHGRPWDPSKGVVFAVFEDRADSRKTLTGGTAKLLTKGSQSFVTDASDNQVAGETVPANSAAPSVEFTDVPPGKWNVDITPPPGLTCFVPVFAPVYAGSYSLVVVSCEPPKE